MLPTGKITEPYVQQHEDGRWMLIAPTADPKTSCCATYCEKEDEAEELLSYWKEGFRVARARFAPDHDAPGFPAPEGAELPPLPSPRLRFEVAINHLGERMDYTASDMQAYARAALAAQGAPRHSYLAGHADGLEWAACLVAQDDPRTGDWMHDDRSDLAAAIRKGPEMPDAEPLCDDQATWCGYVAGMVAAYLDIDSEDERAPVMAKVIERRLWALPTRAVQAPAEAHEAAAWLITGGRLYKEQVVLLEASADDRIATRADGSQKVPLFKAQPKGTHAAWNDAKQAQLNDWFLALPEQRRNALIEDKWMLAGAAFEAGRALPSPAVEADPSAAGEIAALRELLELVIDDMKTCHGECGADYEFKELSTETVEALNLYDDLRSRPPVQPTGEQP